MSLLLPLLPSGRALAQWIQAGGRPRRCSRATTLLYRWRAFWFEQGLDLVPRSAPALPPFPDGEGLLFVMGFWRSGTTILHELMAAAPGCGAPRTWQCMDPLAAMRGAKPQDGPSVRRPMDAIEIGPGSPQEDEFALLALGVPSLYQGFVDPRRLPSLVPLLAQDFWLGQGAGPWADTLAGFLDFCRQPGCGRLAVKSPNHVFRYRALARRFPKATFVWILRDPAQLWTSNLRMWKAMTDRYGLWEVPELGLETFLAEALTVFGRLLADLREDGTLKRQIVIDYRDLVGHPENTLKPLACILGLEGPQAEAWTRTAASRMDAGANHSQSELPAAWREPLLALRALQTDIRTGL